MISISGVFYIRATRSEIRWAHKHHPELLRRIDGVWWILL